MQRLSLETSVMLNAHHRAAAALVLCALRTGTRCPRGALGKRIVQIRSSQGVRLVVLHESSADLLHIIEQTGKGWHSCLLSVATFPVLQLWLSRLLNTERGCLRLGCVHASSMRLLR